MAVVWLVAAAAAVAFVALAPAPPLRSILLPAALAGSLLLALGLQLTVHRPGAVRRVVLSTGGSMLLLLAAALLGELLGGAR